MVEEIVKLRYRDMALLVGEDEQGRARFAVEAVFTYFKSGNRRPQRLVDPVCLSEVALTLEQEDIYLDRPRRHPNMSGCPSSRARAARQSFQTVIH